MTLDSNPTHPFFLKCTPLYLSKGFSYSLFSTSDFFSSLWDQIRVQSYWEFLSHNNLVIGKFHTMISCVYFSGFFAFAFVSSCLKRLVTLSFYVKFWKFLFLNVHCDFFHSNLGNFKSEMLTKIGRFFSHQSKEEKKSHN